MNQTQALIGVAAVVVFIMALYWLFGLLPRRHFLLPQPEDFLPAASPAAENPCASVPSRDYIYGGAAVVFAHCRPPTDAARKYDLWFDLSDDTMYRAVQSGAGWNAGWNWHAHDRGGQPPGTFVATYGDILTRIEALHLPRVDRAVDLLRDLPEEGGFEDGGSEESGFARIPDALFEIINRWSRLGLVRFTGAIGQNALYRRLTEHPLYRPTLGEREGRLEIQVQRAASPESIPSEEIAHLRPGPSPGPSPMSLADRRRTLEFE